MRIPRRSRESGRLIVAGALIAGLGRRHAHADGLVDASAAGRVLLDRAGRGGAGALLGSAMTFSIGVLAWAIPLIIASGGLAAYRAAFAGQAAEQFTGLDIFLSNPTPRRMALGIIASLVGPWAAPWLGWIVVAIAHCGARGARLARAAVRGAAARRVRAVLDLPSHRAGVLQPLRAADRACRRLPRRPGPVRCWNESGATFGSAAIVVASLLVTLPAVKAYSPIPEPCVCGRQRSAAARDEHAQRRRRRASAVRARARNERHRREDSAVAGDARIHRARRVLARRRHHARVVSRQILRAAISSWSIR